MSMKYKRHFSSMRCPLPGRGAELSPLDKGQAGPSVRFPPPALPMAHRTSRRRRAADPGAGSAGLWRGEESIRGEGAHSGPSAEPAAHLAQEAARLPGLGLQPACHRAGAASDGHLRPVSHLCRLLLASPSDSLRP